MGPFDYIIVGAGSSGCVLAERLSRSGRHKILVIESGPVDSSPLIDMPRGFGRTLMDPKLTHAYVAKKTGGRGPGGAEMATLDAWDAHLAQHGAELLAGRLALLDDLVFLELLVALDPDLAEARPVQDGAHLVDVGALGQADHDRRAAREVDAELQSLLDEDREEAHPDERPGGADRPPLVLEEIDVRLAEQLHAGPLI